jgi:hypothetical protein
MPGTSSAKTRFALLPGHDEFRHRPRPHGRHFESNSEAAHPLIYLVATNTTSSNAANDRLLCGQPIKRAADAQILERRVQVFVRLQTSFRALRILAFRTPFSFAERTCSSATEESFS